MEKKTFYNQMGHVVLGDKSTLMLFLVNSQQKTKQNNLR